MEEWNLGNDKNDEQHLFAGNAKRVLRSSKSTLFRVRKSLELDLVKGDITSDWKEQ